MNPDNINQLIKKLQQDPDKFERMFAAQYLAKYSFLESKKYFERAILEEDDPDVVNCIRKILKDKKT